MAFVCETMFTVYAKLALLPSLKVNVAVPTAVDTTLAGLNGTALNGGPVVRYKVPVYTPAEVLVAVTTSHIGV